MPKRSNTRSITTTSSSGRTAARTPSDPHVSAGHEPTAALPPSGREHIEPSREFSNTARKRPKAQTVSNTNTDTNGGAEPITPKKIRGRPFEPGNPGRPPGARNKSTRLVEQLLDGEAEALMRTLIGLALDGNVRCLLDCLERLAPRRNGRPVDFQLPAIKQPQDIIAAMAAIITAVNACDLTAEEAGHLGHVVETQIKAIETHDFAARLDRLEAKVDSHENASDSSKTKKA
jgi:hypothetical protein